MTCIHPCSRRLMVAAFSSRIDPTTTLCMEKDFPCNDATRFRKICIVWSKQ